VWRIVVSPIIPLYFLFGIASRAAIRRLREVQKISQEEPAARCGLYRTYCSGVERGVRNLSPAILSMLIKGLGISLRNLFSRV
jgi:transcriptional regulator with XRE-family HTH domain